MGRMSLLNLSEREMVEDTLFLSTAQENNNSPNTTHMTEAESLVVYILSNFKCGNYNGQMSNRAEVLQSVDQWLQEKEKSGYIRGKNE
jgi:hypothetical protein